ncbi:hypothetical protein O181_092842 [Austropuccinia psidii MF-1]|uniref:Uncharacterized protein n=1 Tax=Austropuccinia psidii MF-1 TaxID=1389203 RepID=A0A9Q3J0B8_9BASI|nr:hypothetical protein [Austropuccinia psidii MF-1]
MSIILNRRLSINPNQTVLDDPNNASTSPRDSSGQPVSDHNNTSTIIKAATALSLILCGLVLLLAILKITTWIHYHAEYNRLKSVKARVAHLESLNLISQKNQIINSNHLNPNPTISHVMINSVKNSQSSKKNLGNKKLRNLFDIQEYEGTPA